jgi:hypothetical protein
LSIPLGPIDVYKRASFVPTHKQKLYMRIHRHVGKIIKKLSDSCRIFPDN